jgi:hypothetical protein
MRPGGAGYPGTRRILRPEDSGARSPASVETGCDPFDVPVIGDEPAR